MSNQLVALVSGMLRAARVKPPKMTAACSHFGPSSTRVSGWASARNKPVKRNAINAIASYRCRNVDRYRSTFLHLYEAIALIAFLFTGLFLALAHPLTLVLLGPKWEQAAVILGGFTLAALSIPLTNATNWLLISQGRSEEHTSELQSPYVI